MTQTYGLSLHIFHACQQKTGTDRKKTDPIWTEQITTRRVWAGLNSDASTSKIMQI
jgi:hypothetical protein